MALRLQPPGDMPPRPAYDDASAVPGPAAALSIASPIQRYLDRLHATYAALAEGSVATYIPELAKANPEWFGIAIATVDGRVYEIGDSRQPFTIQSISKPFTYGLALEDQGRDALLQRVSVEPTGDAFNSISLEPQTGRPFNPMINAGAIATASLVAGRSAADRLARLLAVYGLYAGRPLTLDEPVYASEKATGHRNRAIAHLLRNFGILGGDPEAPLDLYFQQCSVSVTCRDLSIMAATLANGGVNPLTGERAVRDEYVENILSIMTTCGMYDYAGEWLYRVGLPAKSGVAGGVLAVLPGQIGIGVFSPRLDARGNSVRGVQVCRDLSRDFQLHFLHVGRPARSTVRAEYTLARVRSKRVRDPAQRARLEVAGERARVYELQGDLGFPAMEAVIRRIVERSPTVDLVILDLKRVTRVERPATRLLLDLMLVLEEDEKQLAFATSDASAALIRFLQEELAARQDGATVRALPDLDRALEWAENQVLGIGGGAPGTGGTIPLRDHEMCQGLDAAGLAALEALLEPREYAAGDYVVRQGTVADEMFFLVGGQVSVLVGLASGQVRRLATLSAGMAFGELALIDRTTRTADVRADAAVRCYVLSAVAFDALGREHPTIKLTLLQNMLRRTYQVVSQLNQELAALAG
jgi:glutaminase